MSDDVQKIKIEMMLEEFVESIKVHPSASNHYVALIQNICEKYGLTFNGRSGLYGN